MCNEFLDIELVALVVEIDTVAPVGALAPHALAAVIVSFFCGYNFPNLFCGCASLQLSLLCR